MGSKFRANIFLHCSYSCKTTLENYFTVSMKAEHNWIYTSLGAVGNFTLRYHPQIDVHTHKTGKYSIIQNSQNGKNIVSLYSN